MNVIDLCIDYPKYVSKSDEDYNSALVRTIPIFQHNVREKVCVPYLNVRHIYPHKYYVGKLEFIIHGDKLCSTYNDKVVIDNKFVDLIQSKIQSKVHDSDKIKTEVYKDNKYIAKMYTTLNCCKFHDLHIVADCRIEFKLIYEGCNELSCMDCVNANHTRQWKIIGKCIYIDIDNANVINE
jgi:hypothetical protein